MGTDADQARKCRQRAERIRVVADGIANEKLRETMLHLAEDYERLADVMEAEIGVFPSGRAV
jgi:hypothetical protein